MSTHNLFIIILKVIGLFFLKDLIINLIQFVPLLSSSAQTNDPAILVVIFLSGLVGIALYGIVPYFFIYRAEWLVNKLRLTEGIPEILPLAIHRSTVLSIAVIVVGGLLLANELPSLARQLFLYAQERQTGETAPDIAGYLLFTIVKVVIGGLLISKQRQLVAYIELQRKPAATEQVSD